MWDIENKPLRKVSEQIEHRKKQDGDDGNQRNAKLMHDTHTKYSPRQGQINFCNLLIVSCIFTSLLCGCFLCPFSHSFFFVLFYYFRVISIWIDSMDERREKCMRALLCSLARPVTPSFFFFSFVVGLLWWNISSWSRLCMRIIPLGSFSYYLTSLFMIFFLLVIRRSNDKRSKLKYCRLFYLFRAKSIVMIFWGVCVGLFKYRCVINWLKSHNFLV